MTSDEAGRGRLLSELGAFPSLRKDNNDARSARIVGINKGKDELGFVLDRNRLKSQQFPFGYSGHRFRRLDG
jgi:hypothetical protein